MLTLVRYALHSGKFQMSELMLITTYNIIQPIVNFTLKDKRQKGTYFEQERGESIFYLASTHFTISLLLNAFQFLQKVTLF